MSAYTLLWPACRSDDIDEVTGACADVIWTTPPTFIPPMSVEEGLLLSGAIISVIGVAWSLKLVRRFFSRS